MADQLKEIFNRTYFSTLGEEVNRIYKKFDKKAFVNAVLKDLEAMELNQRMRHGALELHNHLKLPYQDAIKIFKEVIPTMPRGYTNLIFPDYVSVFGLDDFKTSMEALHHFTQFGSSEFAIRWFLKNDFDKTMKVMHQWAEDDNHHVRRLASEGCRPRLPWSFKLDRVIENPGLTIPILEKLKADPEPYVQKSVANHLNDISKDHAALIINTVKQWKGDHAATNWIIKHGCRTLLKAGDKQVLALFGTANQKDIALSNFMLAKTKLKLGNDLDFTFTLTNTSKATVSVRVEFAIAFLKGNGSYTKKVFKISEREMPGKSEWTIQKKYTVKAMTTRSYYSGEHRVSIIVNGKESEARVFDLKC